MSRLHTLVAQVLDEALFLSIALSLQIREELTEVEISDQVLLMALLVAHGTLMLSIYDFVDAGFAESVTALCDVRVVERLEADDALGELADDVLHRYLDLLLILGALPLQRHSSFSQHWLNHRDSINDLSQ